MSDARPVPAMFPAPPFEVHVEQSSFPGAASTRVFITVGAGGFTKRGQEIIPPCATLAELEERARTFLVAFEAAFQSAKAKLAETGAASVVFTGA